MSELICCCNCGELSMYDHTIYIHDKPICQTCHAEVNDPSNTKKLDD